MSEPSLINNVKASAIAVLAFTLLAFVTPAAKAAAKVASVFSDNMVLQANANPKIFGTSNPDENIRVTFSGHTASTHADKNGRWNVVLGKLKTGQRGDLKIEATNVINIKNVIAGEVWVCAGQSNMEFEVHKCADAKELLSQAPDDEIRFLLMPPDMSNRPMSEVHSNWQSCDKTRLSDYSAVAFVFARELQKKLHSPVGIIEAAYSGSCIKTWISSDALNQDRLIAEQVSVKPTSPEFFVQYQINRYQQARLAPSAQNKPIAFCRLQPIVPSTLFNAMIAPVVDYSIKGIAWYQGEADAENATLYKKLFPTLIADWRSKWKQSNLPFIYVQLPNFENAYGCNPSKNSWANLRDVQAETLKVPNTAMVVSIDQGAAHDLHPKNKSVVGKRLSAAALSIVYKNKTDYRGPVLGGLKRERNMLICNFTHARQLHVRSYSQPSGFEISAGDNKWMPAAATVKDLSVSLTNTKIALPVSVRYAWANDPQSNLLNEQDQPAGPFQAGLGANEAQAYP